MSGNVTFKKQELQAETIDMCICIKGDDFQETLSSLDKSGQSVNLFLLDGNDNDDLEKFIDSRSWSFNNISLWKDSDVTHKYKNIAGLYDWLIRQGTSKYVGYLSSGHVVNDHFCHAMVLSISGKDRFSCVTSRVVLPDCSNP